MSDVCDASAQGRKQALTRVRFVAVLDLGVFLWRFAVLVERVLERLLLSHRLSLRLLPEKRCDRARERNKMTIFMQKLDLVELTVYSALAGRFRESNEAIELSPG